MGQMSRSAFRQPAMRNASLVIPTTRYVRNTLEGGESSLYECISQPSKPDWREAITKVLNLWHCPYKEEEGVQNKYEERVGWRPPHLRAYSVPLGDLWQYCDFLGYDLQSQKGGRFVVTCQRKNLLISDESLLIGHHFEMWPNPTFVLPSWFKKLKKTSDRF